MNDLVFLHDNQALTTSRIVAEYFEKNHKDVLESIRGILAAENSATKFFRESTFDNRGKFYPMYLMNRDGFSLLAMGFTTVQSLHSKLNPSSPLRLKKICWQLKTIMPLQLVRNLTNR